MKRLAWCWIGVLLAGCAPAGQGAYEGRWAGTGTIGGHPFDVILDVAKAGDSLRATVTSAAQMLLDEPMRHARVEGGVFRAETGSPAERIALEGRVRGDTLQIAGSPLGEAPPGFPALAMQLQRRKAAAPVGYRRRALTVTSGPVQLAGTLFVPAGPGPHPAIVLLQGSSRTEAAGYFAMAARFAAAGIAAYAFDKRGSGASTGRYADATWDDLAADARAVVEAVAQQPDVDPDRVGLWGLSQGAYLAPFVAARTPRVRFLVLVSGGGGAVVEAAAYQDSLRLRRAGASAADAALLAHAHRALGRALASGDTVAMHAAVAPLAGKPWRVRYDLDVPPPHLRGNWYWRGRTYDATEPLRALRLPVLALYGADDDLVPAAASARTLHQALRAHPDATVRVIERADHELHRAFRRLGPGEPVGVAPGVVDTMLAWTRRRAGLVP